MTAVVLRADARNLPLPDACADLIVTSPPFWQLRSYTDGGQHYDGQLGSEPTPREYIDSLLACTREWMRVVKPSGSLFVELGDKYAGSGTSGPPSPSSTLLGNGHRGGGPKIHSMPASERPPARTGAPPKSLIGLPWRYAIRCMDELGLILRAEIAWHHKNGLPESVTDRVRRAHSTVFHFTVRPRYYAAVDEIREPHTGNTHGRRADGQHSPKEQATITAGFRRGYFPENRENPLGKLPGSVWEIPSQPLSVPAHLGVDHFAAFPMELPRRCILGWSPPGICTECGEGRRPLVDKVMTSSQRAAQPRSALTRYTALSRERDGMDVIPRSFDATITGYACACPDATAPVRPALVVDPFGGTGTTALVASMLGRTGISVDLSADYCRLARWRTTDPAERAKALQVPKPPPVPDGMDTLFEVTS